MKWVYCVMVGIGIVLRVATASADTVSLGNALEDGGLLLGAKIHRDAKRYRLIHASFVTQQTVLEDGAHEDETSYEDDVKPAAPWRYQSLDIPIIRTPGQHFD